MLYPGQVYHTTYTVKDQDSAPSGVALAITKPDGTAVTPAPSPSGPEVSGRDYTWSYDYALPAAGRYELAWSSASPGTALLPDVINVRQTAPLAGLAEVKQHLNITTTTDDDELLGFLVAATELVEAKTGPCVRRVITGEFIPGSARDVIRLPSAPLPAASSVTSIASVYSDGPAWAAADLIVNPEAGTVRTVNMQGFWYGPWTAAYTAGRAVIPERLLLACKEQVRHLWETQRGSMPPSVLGSEETFTTSAGFTFTVPRRVSEELERDMMPGFA